MSTKLTPTAFAVKYAPACISACRGTNIFPCVKLAQMALETGWGQSIKGNNCFGIRPGSSWRGKVQSFTTFEYEHGKKKIYRGSGKVYSSLADALSAGEHRGCLFRYYDSIEESIKDHSKFIISKNRYRPVLEAKYPKDQAEALEKCGYSTSSRYGETLYSIIHGHNWERYD